MSAFDQLAAKLAGRGNVSDPRALAAFIGKKKYGAATMGKAAAKGVSAASVAKKQQRY
jgi:hypothetical protein